MLYFLSSRRNRRRETRVIEKDSKVKELISSNPLIVFSKTYCPYCDQVKQLLSQLGASFKAIELDKESDGSELQTALREISGQRTVPNVFIGGNHMGGCDTVTSAHKAGKLIPLLTEAGITTNSGSS